jgi:hypothetical protein
MTHAELEKLALWIFIVVMILCGIGMYFSYKSEAERQKRLVAQTEAVILTVNRRRVPDENGKWVETNNVLISYSYNINTSRFEKTTTISHRYARNFSVGKPAKVCYNPDRYEEHELVPPEYRCGQ